MNKVMPSLLFCAFGGCISGLAAVGFADTPVHTPSGNATCVDFAYCGSPSKKNAIDCTLEYQKCLKTGVAPKECGLKDYPSKTAIKEPTAGDFELCMNYHLSSCTPYKGMSEAECRRYLKPLLKKLKF